MMKGAHNVSVPANDKAIQPNNQTTPIFYTMMLSDPLQAKVHINYDQTKNKSVYTEPKDT